MQISIIGAGISGLVLGRCLLQRGIRAVLFEKSRQSQNRNSYGITLHANSYRPLLKILELDESAFRKRVAVDAGVGGEGRVDEAGSVRANRNRFESLLAEGLDVRWERDVSGVDVGPGDGGVQVKFSDGEKENPEIVVGADGPHSQVRKSILPDVDFKILPFAVYNGKRRLKDEETRRKFAAGGNVFEQKVDDAIFQVSVNDNSPEEVSISYVYSRPAKDGEDALFKPKRSTSDAKAIPDELFEEVDRLKSHLDEPLATIFNTQDMRNDRLLNWLMRTIKIDSERLKDSASKGIVLMGDAIHAEPILGGYGANEAIEDGIKLAEILASGQKDGLREFYEVREGAWNKGVEGSEVRIREMHRKGSAGRPGSNI